MYKFGKISLHHFNPLLVLQQERWEKSELDVSPLLS